MAMPDRPQYFQTEAEGMAWLRGKFDSFRIVHTGGQRREKERVTVTGRIHSGRWDRQTSYGNTLLEALNNLRDWWRYREPSKPTMDGGGES